MVSNNVVSFKRSDARFETILVPIDGSTLSIAAALKAVAFAKRLEARIVVFFSIQAYQYPVYLGGMPYEYPSEIDYDDQCRAIAERYLNLVANAAKEQGVTAITRLEFDGDPAQAIIEAAKRENCNMIFMGSHGRSGLSAVFLGSVTTKTLTLTQIPVVVDRPTSDEIAKADAVIRQSGIDT